jgi:O-antigen/teichoic acid export membrane protein
VAAPEPETTLGQTSGTAVVRGGLWNLLAGFVPQVQVLVLSVVAARFLGPEGTGRQSLIAFAGVTTVLVATVGLPGSVSRFVGELLGARQGGVALGLYRATWRVELVAAALACIGLSLAGLAGSDPALAWVLVGVASGLAVLQTVPAALLGGAQHWREATIVGLVTGIAAVPATIAVLALGGGISGFFAVEVVVAAVNVVWTMHLARRLIAQLRPAERPPPELRQRFLSFAGVTTLTLFLHYVVATRSELFVLDAVSTDTQIALYSIAFAAVTGLARIPEAISRVTMPAVATLLGTGELHRVRSGYWRALRLLLFVTPPVVAGAATTGPALISAAYGGDFSGAGPVLLVMLIPLLLVPLFTTASALLYTLGRLRFQLGVEFAASVLDIGLAILLIPHFEAIGAAIANTAAQLARGIPFLVLAGRLQAPMEIVWGAIARALALALAVAATAGATLLLLGDGPAGAVTAVVTGAGAFLLLGPVARPLAADDAAWLERALEGDDALRRALVHMIRRFSLPATPTPAAA